MRIAVLVKQVPDTWADRQLDVQTGLVDRRSTPRVLDEICEYATETALRLREKVGGEVIAVSMGSDTAAEAVKRTLEMGADEGYLVSDPGLAAADVPVTAAVLAAVTARVQADLVVTGNWSTDGRSGLVAPMLAEHLGIPLLHALDAVELSGATVTGTRTVDGWTQELSAEIPAVVSVTERVEPPRVPGLRSVLKARKRPIHRLALTDLGLEGIASTSTIVSTTVRPPRTPGPVVPFSDDTVRAVVDLLVERRLVEGKLS